MTFTKIGRIRNQHFGVFVTGSTGTFQTISGITTTLANKQVEYRVEHSVGSVKFGGDKNE
jgi:hypothetical protein